MAVHDLDQVDLDLIGLLEEDGRAPFSRLAGALSLSMEAVSARFKRLEAAGILRVIGVVNPSIVGRDTIAALAITNHGDIDGFTRALGDLPEVTFLATTRGEFTIMGELACSDAEALTKVAYEVIPSLSPDVQRVEVWDFMRVVKWSTGSRNAPEPHASPPPVSLDPDDIRVLQLLQQSPRLRYTELAAELGMPYSKVRRRSQRLFDAGVVVPAVVIDRLSVQKRVMATVGLNFDASPTAALEELATEPEVEILIRTSGRYQAIAEVRCESVLELSELIDSRLMCVPGVTAAAVHIYSRILKLPAQWRFNGT